MPDFVTTLRGLLEKATPGELSARLDHPRTALGGVSTKGVPQLRANGRTVAEGFLGDDPANLYLLVYLRNHAEAILRVVEEVETIISFATGEGDVGNIVARRLREALAALDKEA